MRFVVYLLFAILTPVCVFAQGFRYAHITDTHIGGKTAADDLRRTVRDINNLEDVAFVIISGDITEFGSDEELLLAKQVLDSLNKPWYIVSGNHDTNWSESGGNSFLRVFGSDTFSFEWEGILFMGTSSGPMLRMSPGQIPRENLVWMDSVLSRYDRQPIPLVFVNHYPLDNGLNNWYEAIDRLKNYNIQYALCGHGHRTKLMDFEGIPGVMFRSNLRATDSVGAFQLIDFDIAQAESRFFVRYPGVKTEPEPWLTLPLDFVGGKKFSDSTYQRPDYSINQKFPSTQLAWTFEDNSDIGAGLATYIHNIITANTAGELYALDANTGRKRWTFQTNGKIYSTPVVRKASVVVGSSDRYIYCVNAEDGALRWKYETQKAVLGTALVSGDVVYIGGSDGIFRALSLETGELLWAFDQVKGYVSSKPLLYGGNIYFGSWGNGFYALDAKTGRLQWEWSNGTSSRMFSPAACVPVGANGRVFIVAPDRYMTALDAVTGREIWREKKDPYRVRESMGLSDDGKLVYVKTMDGELLGISTEIDAMHVAWQSALQLPYEISPSAITANQDIVLVPSHSGLLSAVSPHTGNVTWQYKISNAMINPALLFGENRVIASTMDGKIVCLIYNNE